MEEVDRPTVVSARVTEYERHLVRAAAAKHRTPVSDWLRETALRAARSELADEETAPGGRGGG